MRFLHTADWHVGKKLGRIDRRAEFEAALDEIVAITKDQKIDVVIVAGDLLDRALAPLDSISLVIDALTRLADAAGRVVAIPGNHDSMELFKILAPLLEPRGIMLTPRISRPGEGGVITVPARDGASSASIAMFPFLHEAQVVDFMASSEEWFKSYTDKVRSISSVLCEALDPKNVGILVGHYFIEGAELGGGERRIHIGEQYAATAQAIPSGASYVALGHIHRPQAIAGAAVPSRYAGSILALDFSERSHAKEVVVVEAEHGRPAKVKSIQLASGRKLIRVEDELENLRARVDEFADAYLDVRVKTAGPTFGLGEQVREFLPNAVIVQAVYERIAGTIVTADGAERDLGESYADYHRTTHGVEPVPELVELLRELEHEVVDAAT